MGSYLLDSNDLSFLKIYCKALFIKHILGTYNNIGTLCSGRTRPFWNYNIGIKSKALESTVGWVPPESDPGQVLVCSWFMKDLLPQETHEGIGAGGRGSEAGFHLRQNLTQSGFPKPPDPTIIR